MPLSELEQDLFDSVHNQFTASELDKVMEEAQAEVRLEQGFVLANVGFSEIVIIENADAKLAVSLLPWGEEPRPLTDSLLLARYQRTNIGIEDCQRLDETAKRLMVIYGSAIPAAAGQFAVGRVVANGDFMFSDAEYVPVCSQRESGMPWDMPENTGANNRYKLIDGVWHELVQNYGQSVLRDVTRVNLSVRDELIFKQE